MMFTAGSRYESQIINETKEILDGGLQGLAVVCFQAANVPMQSRKKSDIFYAGLVYSEFFAEDESEYLAASDYRMAMCKRLGIDSWELYKMVENYYQPGRYK